jgi:hypothetical protein
MNILRKLSFLVFCHSLLKIIVPFKEVEKPINKFELIRFTLQNSKNGID